MLNLELAEELKKIRKSGTVNIIHKKKGNKRTIESRLR